MNKLLAVLFGFMLSLGTISMAPQLASASPLHISSSGVISKDQSTLTEKVRYYGGYRHGYGRYGYGRGYGYRHYGYGRGYGYRRYGYRPLYYGGYRRCGLRTRTYFNGYRYVRRAVRVCRY